MNLDDRKEVWNNSLKQHLEELFPGYTVVFHSTSASIRPWVLNDDDRRFLKSVRIAA